MPVSLIVFLLSVGGSSAHLPGSCVFGPRDQDESLLQTEITIKGGRVIGITVSDEE